MVHDLPDWNEQRQAEHEERKVSFRRAHAYMTAFHDAAERGDWGAANRVLEEVRKTRAVQSALAPRRAR